MKINGQVTGVTETVSALQQLPSLLRQAGMAAMTDTLNLLSETLRKDFLEGPYPQEIQSRTGSFRATFRRGHPDNIFRVDAQGTTVTGTFGSTDKRGRILNTGGVIYPRRGSFLAIRTDFTKTPRGVVRPKYQQSLRNLPNTFVRPIYHRRGTAEAAVFERRGRTSVPIAWLVRQAYIRGRHFMEKTVAKVSPQIQPIFQRRFQTLIDRMNQTLARVRGR